MLSAITATIMLALAAAPQNELELTSGKVLKVKRIKSETYKEVVYQTMGGGDSKKDAGDVIEIRHDLTPKPLDDFAAAMAKMDEGSFAEAVPLFRAVLNDEGLLGRSSYAWVKQHSLFNQAKCMFALADMKGVAATVDKLLADTPDTFFYAPALMLKAQALVLAENPSQAKKVFETLATDVSAKDLPERWARESELGLVLLDSSLKGKAKERALAGLAEKNGTKFPTVASRANVEVGNVMVEGKEYDKAQRFFEKIVRSGQADSSTLAAAYSGLGDCHYYRALSMESDRGAAKEEFKFAAVNHLRVITMYKDAVGLVPRCLYFSAQSMVQMGAEDSSTNARQLASRLKRYYPQSPWWDRLATEWNLSK
ncbi:MAG: hypothetical protein HQ519_11455 [Planctomycetes bacterium]|nr:hypothetical protein [Planctomycetota bacterium]